MPGGLKAAGEGGKLEDDLPSNRDGPELLEEAAADEVFEGGFVGRRQVEALDDGAGLPHGRPPPGLGAVLWLKGGFGGGGHGGPRVIHPRRG